MAAIVEEDIAFGPENLGISPAEIQERVSKALELVGMEEYRLHAPHLLSGGQKATDSNRRSTSYKTYLLSARRTYSDVRSKNHVKKL